MTVAKPMPKHLRVRPVHLVMGTLAIVLALAAHVRAAAEELWEHWYILEIAGAPAGWVRESVTSNDGRYVSRSETRLRIRRGLDKPIEISMTTEFIESHAGEPIEVRSIQDLSREKMDTRWIFEPGKVVVVSIAVQGDREFITELPRPEGEWLTPMAAHRFGRERLEAGATEVEFRTLDPEHRLEPVSVRHERTGEGTYAHDGRDLPVTIWTSTNSAMPGIASTVKVAADGHVVYEETEVALGRMVQRIATKEEALATEKEQAPEMFVTLFVPVDRPFPNARGSTTARVRVRVRDGRMPELPTAGAQRVTMGEDGTSATLEIDVEAKVEATAAEIADQALLRPSSMVDSGDELIIKLARSACRDAGDDPLERAEAMRRAVAKLIATKELDTAFASASETARLRRGDCSEHGVLLCALLRADGIPARVATGLVYMDTFAGERDQYGWHMWTQALIDGRWVDLDATLEKAYDAAHILTATSSLAEGSGASELMTIMFLLGNLDVEILDAQAAAPAQGEP